MSAKIPFRASATGPAAGFPNAGRKDSRQPRPPPMTFDTGSPGYKEIESAVALRAPQ